MLRQSASKLFSNVFSRSLRLNESAAATVGAGGKAFATEASKGKDAEPTYTYQSPGSSMREPLYNLSGGHSLGSPHYELADPKPAKPYTPPEMSGTKEQAQERMEAAVAAANRSGTEEAKDEGKDAAFQTPYVYASPGSSLKEPGYGFSMRDPVYMVDPKPTKEIHVPSVATESAAPPSPPLSETQGTPKRLRMGLKVDDLANQTYVTSASGSMREPQYVSISDPLDRISSVHDDAALPVSSFSGKRRA